MESEQVNDNNAAPADKNETIPVEQETQLENQISKLQLDEKEVESVTAIQDESEIEEVVYEEVEVEEEEEEEEEEENEEIAGIEASSDDEGAKVSLPLRKITTEVPTVETAEESKDITLQNNEQVESTNSSFTPNTNQTDTHETIVINTHNFTYK